MNHATLATCQQDEYIFQKKLWGITSLSQYQCTRKRYQQETCIWFSINACNTPILNVVSNELKLSTNNMDIEKYKLRNPLSEISKFL